MFSIGAGAQTINKKTGLANITVEMPEEVLIERGWTSYISFSVKNTGETLLNNVYIFMESKYNWLDFPANRTYTLQINDSESFTSKILVPYETPIGNYVFSLNIRSNEIDYSKGFNVRVFDARDDMLLYQIQKLRERAEGMEGEAKLAEKSSVNLTYARGLISQIKSELMSAEQDVLNGMYTQVTVSIREIENMLIKVRFEIDNPPPAAETKIQASLPAESVLFFVPPIIMALLTISLIYLIRKTKLQNRVRLPNLKLKEAIVENKRVVELEKEISRLINSQKLIDEEYRKNIISRESYEELRLKYQEKLIALESEKKRLRGY